jgi:hypothetical protein
MPNFPRTKPFAFNLEKQLGFILSNAHVGWIAYYRLAYTG